MLFAFQYFKWHYTQAIVDYYRIVLNFVWFFYNFFSINLSIKTLFSPFHRLGQEYKGGLQIGNFIEAVIVNSIMRLIGFLMRVFIILIGLVFILLTVFVGIFFFFVWIFSPILLLFLILYGFKMISLP